MALLGECPLLSPGSKTGKIEQIFKQLLCVNRSWAMENFYTVKNYIHHLISDPLFSPIGDAIQKLQHLSGRRFWPNLQTAAARKPFMGYGKFYTVRNYIHELISDSLLSPFNGNAKQKLKRLSRILGGIKYRQIHTYVIDWFSKIHHF
jgi:hypothetical protein